MDDNQAALDALPPVNRRIWDSYTYRNNVDLRGLTIDGKPGLTGIDPAQVGDYVMLFVRDPLCAYGEDPATQVARRFDNPVKIGDTGMFTSWSGTYQGAHITAISGGSGGPEIELCLVELLEYTNASTYLRVGGSGGTHDKVRAGDVVIARGIVRAEGLTSAYVENGWPAVCSTDVVIAMAEAAKSLGVRYHVGLTRSADSDFGGCGRPSVKGFIRHDQLHIIDQCRQSGVLNGEREAAAIVTMATLFGRRAGSVCSVADNIVTGERFIAGAGQTAAIDVALAGLVLLARMDQACKDAGAEHWLPSLGGIGQ
jgi:uridine phosphorylase